MPVAGSIFGPLSQTHISKSEFKNGHISRFCSVFQVIQVISSAKFFSAEEVDLSFNSWIWIHESDFKDFFLEKRLWKRFSIKCSNSGINESTPQTQNNVKWISSKADLKISFLNSLLEMWVWESDPKIDPATGATWPRHKSSKKSRVYYVHPWRFILWSSTVFVFASPLYLKGKPFTQDVIWKG